MAKKDKIITGWVNKKTEHDRSRFKIIGVDSGVGVEVYKYSFLQEQNFINFVKTVAKLNPDKLIEIEFSSMFNHDDIKKWENAAKNSEGVKEAAMDIVRTASRQDPDIIVGACNTLNVTLISPDKNMRTPYQDLIEEGIISYNPLYEYDVKQPIMGEGARSRVSQPSLSYGILDATSAAIYLKSVLGKKDNIIEQPAVAKTDKKKKVAVVISSTKKTAKEGTYKKNIKQLHEDNPDKEDIELDIIETGVTWACWLNKDPNPAGQKDLQKKIKEDVKNVVEKIIKDFSINELIEMSPVQIGFCCTHFPLVKDEVMAEFDKAIMGELKKINGTNDYEFKNNIDEELVKKVLSGEKQITFEPIVQGPGLVEGFTEQFKKKFKKQLNLDFNEIKEEDGKPIDNISIISSIEGKTGEKIPESSFKKLADLYENEVKSKYKENGINLKFQVKYEDKVSLPINYSAGKIIKG